MELTLDCICNLHMTFKGVRVEFPPKCYSINPIECLTTSVFAALQRAHILNFCIKCLSLEFGVHSPIKLVLFNMTIKVLGNSFEPEISPKDAACSKHHITIFERSRPLSNCTYANGHQNDVNFRSPSNRNRIPTSVSPRFSTLNGSSGRHTTIFIILVFQVILQFQYSVVIIS